MIYKTNIKLMKLIDRIIDNLLKWKQKTRGEVKKVWLLYV